MPEPSVSPGPEGKRGKGWELWPPPPCLGHAWAQLTQGPEGLSQPQFPHLQTRGGVLTRPSQAPGGALVTGACAA